MTFQSVKKSGSVTSFQPAGSTQRCVFTVFCSWNAVCDPSSLKGSVMVVSFLSRGVTPWKVIRNFHLWTITSLLLNRFFSAPLEMKARDQAVPVRYCNKEYAVLVSKYCMVLRNNSSLNQDHYHQKHWVFDES